MHPDFPSLDPSLPPDFIGRVERLRLTTTDAPWPLAMNDHAAIGAHFDRRRSGNPAFFDGRVFVLRQLRREPDAVAGTFSLERFSAFLYWRDGAGTDSTVLDGFATAVVRSAEGHVLAGRAAPNTLNAGRVYLPGGFIDARDRRPDGTIDIDASVARELSEETGLAVADLTRMPGYIVARHGRHCCFSI
jgi:8-oxo-dGTP pyrophosphatase MutT (NUDIX family)